MKRKVVRFMAVMAGILAMTACGQKETNITTKKEEVSTEKQTTSTKEKSEKKAAELSEDLLDFQISIDDRIYQVPMTYAKYVKAGWAYQGAEESTVHPSQMLLSEWFTKGQNQSLAYLTNFDVQDVTVSESYLGGLMIDLDYMKEEDTKVLLAEEIELGVSTREEVVEAYGEPTSVKESETFPIVTYALDETSYVELGFDAEEGNVLSEIMMMHPVRPKKFEESEIVEEDQSADDESEDVYEEPEAMSEDLFDYTVTFAGDLYQLPAPVSAFVDRGWILVEEKSTLVVAGKSTGAVTLTRDGQTLWIQVSNDSEVDAPIETCQMTNLAANVKDCNVEMEIAGGIHMGMAQAELEQAIAQYEYKKEVSSYTYYEIYEPDQEEEQLGYEIIVRDGKVAGIEITT